MKGKYLNSSKKRTSLFNWAKRMLSTSCAHQFRVRNSLCWKSNLNAITTMIAWQMKSKLGLFVFVQHCCWHSSILWSFERMKTGINIRTGLYLSLSWHYGESNVSDSFCFVYTVSHLSQCNNSEILNRKQYTASNKRKMITFEKKALAGSALIWSIAFFDALSQSN